MSWHPSQRPVKSSFRKDRLPVSGLLVWAGFVTVAAFLAAVVAVVVEVERLVDGLRWRL